MEQKLKVFLTVVKHMNFSRAAKELFITQPAVSQYIKSYEEELGVQLIDRSHKKIKLTQAGTLVSYYGSEIFTLHEKMRQAVEDLSGEVKGKLAVGGSYSFGEYILPHIVADFLTMYPSVDPHITIGNTQEIADKVLHNEIDLGVVEGTVASDKLIAEKIASDKMFVIKGKKELVEKRVHLNEETWIVREQGSGTREAFDWFVAKNGIRPAKILEFGSTQIIKEAVEAGLGVALLSEWTIRNELELEKLKIIGGGNLYYERNFYAIVPNAPFITKTAETFLRYLRNTQP